MPRMPEGFVPKERVSLTLDKGILDAHKLIAEREGFKSFSTYIEDLLKRRY